MWVGVGFHTDVKDERMQEKAAVSGKGLAWRSTRRSRAFVAGMETGDHLMGKT
jgi:hypothetical protein